ASIVRRVSVVVTSLMPKLTPGLELGIQSVLRCPNLAGGVAGSEVFGLEDLPKLDLDATVEGGPLEPFDGLFLRPNLPQPVAGNQFLSFGERAIDHGSLLSREPDPGAFRAGLEALAGEHHAGIHELLIVLPHL